MGNIIKTLALLIVLSSASTKAKADRTHVSFICKVIAHESEDSYKLIYQGAKKEDVKVEWTKANGKAVYSEKYRSIDSFVKQYNLSGLPDGRYFVTVVVEDYSFTEAVELGDLSAFNFVLRSTDNKNVILTGSQPQGKEVTVTIMDENEDLIYRESLDRELIQKKYNFGKVKTGEVTFVLFHNGTIFKKESITF